MASTGTQGTPDAPAKHKQDEQRDTRSDTKPKTPKEAKIAELEGFYGVNHDGDDKAFIEDCNKAGVDMSAGYRVGDPVQLAVFDEKLGQFRTIVENDANNGKIPAEFKDALDQPEFEGVSLSFPDENTFKVIYGGKEDTGHVSGGFEAVQLAATRLKNGGFAV